MLLPSVEEVEESRFRGTRPVRTSWQWPNIRALEMRPRRRSAPPRSRDAIIYCQSPRIGICSVERGRLTLQNYSRGCVLSREGTRRRLEGESGLNGAH